MVRTMGSASVELVQSIYADWERGDFSSAEWADPDIEYVVADGPDPESRRGVAAMAEANRAFLSAWASFRVRADDFLEVDGERARSRRRPAGRLAALIDHCSNGGEAAAGSPGRSAVSAGTPGS
jgi:hypothetical protein